jgi:putative CocE/NonD family hydrolase
MIPYGNEFATITIPVLTTTGYYDSGQKGALYYFTEHYRHNPAANHYLVIGPYDHVRGQRGTISPLGASLTSLRGYTLDSVAQIEIPGLLRYEWFDYVFKGGAKPALLKNRVNYEVMGANVWKHAPSVDAMGPEKLRLYLSAERFGTGYRMTPREPAVGKAVTQTVSLADRSDVDQPIIDQALDGWNIIDDAPHIGNAISFATDPFTTPIEVSGRFSGRLDFIANKKDFDLSVTLFELTAKGQYFQLSYYWVRASYGKDRSHRRLLTPGKHEQLIFESGRLTSRQFQPGSRLVVVLGVIKQPGEQINYGTGRDVSQETIAAAKEPLRVEWLDKSFITAPVGR